MGNGKWGVGCGEWGVGSGECEVRNGECEMRNAKWGVGNAKCEMGSGVWGVGNAKCEMRNAKCEMRNAKWEVGKNTKAHLQNPQKGFTSTIPQDSPPHELRKGRAAMPRGPFAIRGVWGDWSPHIKKGGRGGTGPPTQKNSILLNTAILD